MSFVNLRQSSYSPDPEIDLHLSPPRRPKFHHQNTNDRIREGSRRPPSFSMISKIKKDRKSVFKELGLDTDTPSPQYPGDHEPSLASPRSTTTRASGRVPESESDGDGDDGRSETEKTRAPHEAQDQHSETDSIPRTPTSPSSSSRNKPWYSGLMPGRRPRIKTVSSAPPSTMNGLTRLSTTALLIAVVLPAFSYFNGRTEVSLSGADAGVIRSRAPAPASAPTIEARADSPTDVCTRWAGQTAQLNGTLYIYGGQAKTSADQTTNTWNNNFLTLDLTKSWDVSSPAIRGLPQPSGPPAVSLGYLWNDYNNLFLYGGEFADNPFVEPAPVSTWKYSIHDQKWTEYKDQKTLAGNNSDGGNTPVQRSAEGAGLSVPELGMSWYFGGHLDLSTTPGWSNQVARVYLKSLLEFTHPGFGNDGVHSLVNSGAAESGAYRNITEGGLQTDAGFSERADGVLVFVPGWGDKGVLIGLAGGTDSTFTNDFSTLDVYDIAKSEWYHQETRGDPPAVRVNPCAVIASAPDASSFQIYLYGGQNLQPYKEQIQYDDMYILSIPSFTWIKAPQSGSNKPAPRAGHMCNLRDGQIVVVGGYVGKNIPCDSPGIYVFDASTLEWVSSFTALDHPADLNPENSVLANSFGYRVPDVVASVIGGDENGGATATTPAAGPATGGPFATGKSPAFTITDAGSTATVTRWGPGATTTGDPVPGNNIPGSNTNTSSPSEDRRAGLIAACVIAGIAGLLAAYLGYCAWLYRRQVRAYKSHLAISNRYSPAGYSTGGLSGFAAFFGGRKSSKESKKSDRSGRGGAGAAAAAAATAGARESVRRHHLRDTSTSTGGDRNSWQQPAVEPKYSLFDDEPTPESGYYSASNTGSHATRPPPVPGGAWWRDDSHGGSSGTGVRFPSGSGTGTTPGTGTVPSYGATPAGEKTGGGGGDGGRRTSGESSSSAEALLEGQEPSFFSVVLGPRRALRVVNGLEGADASSHDHDERDDDDDEERMIRA